VRFTSGFRRRSNNWVSIALAKISLNLTSYVEHGEYWFIMETNKWLKLCIWTAHLTNHVEQRKCLLSPVLRRLRQLQCNFLQTYFVVNV